MSPGGSRPLDLVPWSRPSRSERRTAVYAALAVVVALLVVTTCVVYFVNSQIDEAYVSSATFVVVGPNTRDAGGQPSGTAVINPMLGAARSAAEQNAAAITESMADATVLGDSGVPIEFTVSHTPRSPILRIGVEAGTSARSLDALETVISAVETSLEERQATLAVSDDRYLRLYPIRRTDVPRLVSAPRFKIALAVGLLGVMLTVAVGSGVLRRAEARRPSDGSRVANRPTAHGDLQPTPPPRGT